MSRDNLFMAPGRPNMWNRRDQNVGYVRRALCDAFDSFRGLADDATEVPLERIESIVEARQLLHDLDRFLPSVIAWCVVKHYARSEGGAWEPRVWCGLATEEQAATFRDAIASHYDKQADQHGWARDTWTVEHRACRVTEMIRSDVTAAEYVQRVLR